jgi:hypothetical protein
MYSTFNYEDIEVVDVEGLKEYLRDKLKEEKVSNTTSYLEGLSIDGKAITLESINELTADNLSFSGFDEWKIISYWYDDFVSFLNEMAVFIEGNIKWTFENDDEGGSVRFEDGELIVVCGSMVWTEHKADTFLSNNYKLPEKLQSRKLARKI